MEISTEPTVEGDVGVKKSKHEEKVLDPTVEGDVAKKGDRHVPLGRIWFTSTPS